MSDPAVPPSQAIRGEMPFLVLLDEAMRWTRRYFRAIYPAAAVPMALIGACSVAGQAIWLRPGAELAGDPLVLLTRMGTYLLFLCPLAVAVWLARMAMQVGTLDAVAGRGVDMRRAWLFVVRPRILGTEALRGMAMFASLLCCLFPALYVFPLLCFTMAAMVEERIFFTAALNRSVELAHYNPQRKVLSSPLVQVLAVMLVGLLLDYLVSLIVSLPVSAGQLITIFRRAAAGEPMRNPSIFILWTQVATQLVITLLQAAVMLYVQFVISLLFFDLRRRREGADLRQAIDALGPSPGLATLPAPASAEPPPPQLLPPP